MHEVDRTGYHLAGISRARTLIRHLIRKIENSLPASRGGMKKSLSSIAAVQAETLLRIQNLERIFSSVSSDRMRNPAMIGNASHVSQQDVRDLLRFIEPNALVDCTKMRVGDAGDGGYIQAEDLVGVARAFSFGIDTNDSWDVQMTRLGVSVEQFDYSIEHPPSTAPMLRFHKLFVSHEAGAGKITVPELLARHDDPGDAPYFLKIDIEGAEWDIFDQLDCAHLARFSQIVCEFHDLSRLGEASFHARAKRVFAKINALFACIHVHGNNCASLYNVLNIPVPDVIEVSYVLRERHRVCASNETFPTRLDHPNSPERPDILLGSFRF